MPISNRIKVKLNYLENYDTKMCPKCVLGSCLLQNHLTFRIFVSSLYLCGISMFKDIQIDSRFKIFLMTSHLCQLNIV